MRWGVALVVLTACNQVYGLEQTELAPAADRDDDGIQDPLDNCADVANADQNDEDGDLIGDRCDNCPLVANARQQAVGDSDTVGDACDPRPDRDGDCLILVDTLLASAAFDTHWSLLVEPGDTPTIVPEAGSVTITPTNGSPVGMLVRDDAGALLTGTFDVQVAARAGALIDVNASIAAVSNTTELDGGFICEVYGNTVELVQIIGLRTPMGTAYLTYDPILEPLLIRLVIDGLDVHCRIDHGVAVGSHQATAFGIAPGSPGVYVNLIEARIDAVALYQRTELACPEVMWR